MEAPSMLQRDSVRVISTEECRKSYRNYFGHDPICASSMTSKSICYVSLTRRNPLHKLRIISMEFLMKGVNVVNLSEC